MNNRNTENTDNTERTLISYLRQMFRERQNTSTNPNEDTSENQERENDVLQILWSRLQGLSTAQRSLVINSISSHIVENESENENSDDELRVRSNILYSYLLLGRYHFYDEDAESQDEVDNPQIEEDYVDFRTYPLPIDWLEIENEKSDAYQICEKFGYFGVSIFASLTKVNHLKLSSKKFLKSILVYYSDLIEKFEKNKNNSEIYKQIESFISNLPNLNLLKKVLNKGLICKKEILCMKIIFDLYENFYTKFYEERTKLNEFIKIALIFYSYLSDEEVIYINDKLSNMTEITEILSK